MKQKTAQEMRPILELYSQYEGSKRTFCKERGIAEHTLDYWRRKLSVSKQGCSAFIALEVDRRSTGGTIDLHYPNGLRAVVPMETPASVWEHLLKMAN